MKYTKKKIFLYFIIIFIFLICATFAFTEQPRVQAKWLSDKPIAHRALIDNHLIENSLDAITSCIHQKFAIEIDVRMTRDGHAIVFHDPELSRMTTSSRLISDITLQEVSRIRLLNSNQKIPTLIEVLKKVSGRTPILIDIKGGEGIKLAKEVLRIVKIYEGNVAIQSNNPLIVTYLKQNSTNIPIGQVSSLYEGHPKIKGIMKYTLSKMYFNLISKPDFITFGLNSLDQIKLNNLKKIAGKKSIILWTVTDTKHMNIVKKCGCNYLFEGNPKLFVSD